MLKSPSLRWHTLPGLPFASGRRPPRLLAMLPRPVDSARQQAAP